MKKNCRRLRLDQTTPRLPAFEVDVGVEHPGRGGGITTTRKGNDIML